MKTLLIISTILLTAFHTAAMGWPATGPYPYQLLFAWQSDSLSGIWKRDTLNLEQGREGTFPDIIVQAKGASVFLKWTVSDNQGIALFYIERSTDLQQWSRIYSLEPLASGLYEYIDTPSLEGIIYYRVCLAGSTSPDRFSNVKAVNLKGSDQFLVWPNPVHDRLFIQTHFNSGSIEVMDISGRLMSKTIIRNTITSIPVQRFSAGIYVLRIKYNDDLVFSVHFIRR